MYKYTDEPIMEIMIIIFIESYIRQLKIYIII